jgi:hypothetical protein
MELPDRSAEQIEKDAIMARRAIKTCSVKWETKMLVLRGQSSTRIEVCKIWADGKKLGIDSTISEHGKLLHHNIQCLPCDKEGHFLRYVRSPNPNESYPAKIRPYTEISKKLSILVDPRMLGMLPYSIETFPFEHLEGFVASPKRGATSVRKDAWNGLPCYVVESISQSLRGNPKMTIWVVPSMGNGIVRLSMDRGEGKGRYVTVADIQLAQYGPEKIWYPSRCEYIAREADKIYAHEITTTSEVKINEGLPPDAFQLAGIKFPESTIILDDTKKSNDDILVVKEGKLTKPDLPKSMDLVTPIDEPSDSSTWWFFTGYLGFLALVLTGYGIYRGRRHATN